MAKNNQFTCKHNLPLLLGCRHSGRHFEIVWQQTFTVIVQPIHN